MRPHLHLFVTQSDRNEAVDRIMAAILDSYQPHSLTAAALPPLGGLLNQVAGWEGVSRHGAQIRTDSYRSSDCS